MHPFITGPADLHLQVSLSHFTSTNLLQARRSWSSPRSHRSSKYSGTFGSMQPQPVCASSVCAGGGSALLPLRCQRHPRWEPGARARSSERAQLRSPTSLSQKYSHPPLSARKSCLMPAPVLLFQRLFHQCGMHCKISLLYTGIYYGGTFLPWVGG